MGKFQQMRRDQDMTETEEDEGIEGDIVDRGAENHRVEQETSLEEDKNVDTEKANKEKKKNDGDGRVEQLQCDNEEMHQGVRQVVVIEGEGAETVHEDTDNCGNELLNCEDKAAVAEVAEVAEVNQENYQYGTHVAVEHSEEGQGEEGHGVSSTQDGADTEAVDGTFVDDTDLPVDATFAERLMDRWSRTGMP